MQWARLQTDLNIEIRRGAWYRIRRIGSLQAVIEVRGQQFAVPVAFLEVIDKPPREWTVVPRPRDAVHMPASWGDRYGVCPSCRERQQIVGRPRRMTCSRCRGGFQVGWKDALLRSQTVNVRRSKSPSIALGSRIPLST